mmetsp:Transcript_29677/g.36813  ORF Transcript_29677/g.36813 Transcript_29677/m.36813 type:complete len:155 (+) Transcript_29677:42-506(+)|eukprot:CAMPEP_0170460490 /NCGR_PEP_ID=MMETSP0123-20130129/6821_1 /TAXON_ID=182087 /ORGANISM="Favella ehrenbergii, Strain Fehren 1" /LENGTH=154 /DNA_ID=CAMNT_0010725413 /DNA_START=31 /DNA_END=495 /DNA_ORIENTATION=+
MSWLLNRMFSVTTSIQKVYWRTYMGRHNSIQGAQTMLYKDLDRREQERHVLFQRELAERETEDVLERALLKAYHSKLNGAIPAADYYRVEAKVESLKKLRFTEEYERLQDRETYEYMKYKVAAEVGGPEELEAFKLYERTRIDEVGQERYSLFA